MHTVTDLVHSQLLLPGQLAILIYRIFFQKEPACVVEHVIQTSWNHSTNREHKHFVPRSQEVVIANVVIVTGCELCLL